MHSPARARDRSHGPPQTPTEAQEATPTSIAFGVSPARLPEDTSQDRGGALLSNTSVLHSPEPEPLKIIQAIAAYQPPKPVDTPQIEGVWWEEGVMEGAPLPLDWKPTKITQDDLDRVFKEPLDPTAKAEGSSEGNPEGTSLVLGFPAGYESELGSNLGELELEAPSDQFSDFEDEVEGRTRPTRPASSYLSSKIAQDKSERVDKKGKERNEPSAVYSLPPQCGHYLYCPGEGDGPASFIDRLFQSGRPVI